jgi:hypothetical protein
MTNLQTSKDDFVFEKEIGEGSFSRVTHNDLKKGLPSNTQTFRKEICYKNNSKVKSNQVRSRFY